MDSRSILQVFDGVRPVVIWAYNQAVSSRDQFILGALIFSAKVTVIFIFFAVVLQAFELISSTDAAYLSVGLVCGSAVTGVNFAIFRSEPAWDCC